AIHRRGLSGVAAFPLALLTSLYISIQAASSVYVGLNHSIDLMHLTRSSAGNVDQSAASFSRVLFSVSIQPFSLSPASRAYENFAAARQLDDTSQLGTPPPATRVF